MSLALIVKFILTIPFVPGGGGRGGPGLVGGEKDAVIGAEGVSLRDSPRDL